MSDETNDRCPNCGSTRRDIFILGCVPRHVWHTKPARRPKDEIATGECSFCGEPVYDKPAAHQLEAAAKLGVDTHRGDCPFLGVAPSNKCPCQTAAEPAAPPTSEGERQHLRVSYEGLCVDCGHEYATPWFAPNELWNAVVKGPAMLCPSCFIFRAEKAGINESWKLDVELTWTGEEVENFIKQTSEPPPPPTDSLTRLMAPRVIPDLPPAAPDTDAGKPLETARNESWKLDIEATPAQHVSPSAEQEAQITSFTISIPPAALKTFGIFPEQPEAVTQGSSSAANWLKSKHIDTFSVVCAEKCGNDINDRHGRIYGCCRPNGHDGDCETLDDRRTGKYLNEAPSFQLPELLETYAASLRERIVELEADRIALKAENAWLKEVTRLSSNVSTFQQLSLENAELTASLSALKLGNEEHVTKIMLQIEKLEQMGGLLPKQEDVIARIRKLLSKQFCAGHVPARRVLDRGKG